MKPNCKDCRVPYAPTRCKACREQYRVADPKFSMRATNLPSRSHPRGYGAKIPVDLAKEVQMDGLEKARKRDLEALRNP